MPEEQGHNLLSSFKTVDFGKSSRVSEHDCLSDIFFAGDKFHAEPVYIFANFFTNIFELRKYAPY